MGILDEIIGAAGTIKKALTDENGLAELAATIAKENGWDEDKARTAAAKVHQAVVATADVKKVEPEAKTAKVTALRAVPDPTPETPEAASST